MPENDNINLATLSLRELERRLEQRQQAFRETAENLQRLIDQRRSETLVQCGHCSAAFKVKDLTYIQMHYYVAPSGCNDGDYWRPEEGRWECPSCQRENRLWNKRDVVELKTLF